MQPDKVTYSWVARMTQYKPNENKIKPWAVDYWGPGIKEGTAYFKTLEDALDFISNAQIEEVPF
jgi:hypothetical protein